MAKTPEPNLALALQSAFKNARNRDDIMDNIKSVENHAHRYEKYRESAASLIRKEIWNK